MQAMPRLCAETQRRLWCGAAIAGTSRHGGTTAVDEPTAPCGLQVGIWVGDSGGRNQYLDDHPRTQHGEPRAFLLDRRTSEASGPIGGRDSPAEADRTDSLIGQDQSGSRRHLILRKRLSSTSGIAPCPLADCVKNVGVPVTPRLRPRDSSLASRAVVAELPKQRRNASRSGTPAKTPSRTQFVSACHSTVSKRRSWIAGNRPCASAQMEARAAPRAAGCDGRGKWR